jgi:hypothetical protein
MWNIFVFSGILLLPYLCCISTIFLFLFLLIFNVNIYALCHLRLSKANLLSGPPIHSEWYIEAISPLSLEGAANLPSGRPIHSQWFIEAIGLLSLKGTVNLPSSRPIHSQWYIEAIGLLSLKGTVNLQVVGRSTHNGILRASASSL